MTLTARFNIRHDTRHLSHVANKGEGDRISITRVYPGWDAFDDFTSYFINRTSPKRQDASSEDRCKVQCCQTYSKYTSM